jgi:hypothetical protein
MRYRSNIRNTTFLNFCDLGYLGLWWSDRESRERRPDARGNRKRPLMGELAPGRKALDDSQLAGYNEKTGSTALAKGQR